MTVGNAGPPTRDPDPTRERTGMHFLIRRPKHGIAAKKRGLETLGKSLHAMGGPCSEKRLKTSYFRTGPTHFRTSSLRQ